MVNFTKDLTFSFTTPHWSLWYLFALMVYYILLPFVEIRTKRSALIAFGCSLVIVIIAYFVEHNNIGKFLALSKLISFYPYFLAGYYSRRIFNVEKLIQMPNKNKIKWSIIFVPIYIIANVLFILMDIPDDSIFRMAPPTDFKHSILFPAMMLISNFAFISLTLLWIPNIKVPVVSYLGQNTMPVYVLHAAVILLVRKFKLFDHFSEFINILISLILSVITIALFGNKAIAKLFKLLFH